VLAIDRPGVALDLAEGLVARDARDLMNTAAGLGQASTGGLSEPVRGALGRQPDCKTPFLKTRHVAVLERRTVAVEQEGQVGPRERIEDALQLGMDRNRYRVF
jgi:hypothetical protein